MSGWVREWRIHTKLCTQHKMFLGRIVGKIIATVKVGSLEGVPLLLMEPIDEKLQPAGEAIVVADSIGVGSGEIVYWEGGSEAPLALKEDFAPVDAAVVGIVDSLGKVTQTRRRRSK